MARNLSKYLPSSVRIMALTLGARSFGFTVNAVSTTIRIDLNKYNTSSGAANLNYFANPALPPPPFAVGFADTNVVNDASSPYNIIFGADLNGTPNTIIKTVDLTNVNSATGAPGGGTDVSLDYILGKGYNLSTTVNVEIQRDVLAPDLDLYISPIVVKYRW